MSNPMQVAVLGGTGPQGRGLALHFARAGHAVFVGSRDARRAKQTADEIATRTSAHGPRPQGMANADAVAAADLVLLAVPYAGQDSLVEELGDKLVEKIVISCVNPLGFDKAGPYGLDLGDTSAAETLQARVPSRRWWERSTTSLLPASGPLTAGSITRTSWWCPTTRRRRSMSSSWPAR